MIIQCDEENGTASFVIGIDKKTGKKFGEHREKSRRVGRRHYWCELQSELN